jgi:hypothetical protein
MRTPGLGGAAVAGAGAVTAATVLPNTGISMVNELAAITGMALIAWAVAYKLRSGKTA